MQTCCCQYWMQHQFLRPKSCQQIEVISAKVCNQLKLVKNAPDSGFEEKNKQLDCIQKNIFCYPVTNFAYIVVSQTKRLCPCSCIPDLQIVRMLVYTKLTDYTYVVASQNYRLCLCSSIPDLQTVPIWVYARLEDCVNVIIY